MNYKIIKIRSIQRHTFDIASLLYELELNSIDSKLRKNEEEQDERSTRFVETCVGGRFGGIGRERGRVSLKFRLVLARWRRIGGGALRFIAYLHIFTESPRRFIKFNVFIRGRRCSQDASSTLYTFEFLRQRFLLPLPQSRVLAGCRANRRSLERRGIATFLRNLNFIAPKPGIE